MTTCIEKQEAVPFPLHELLADLRSGMSEDEVAEKYGLSPYIFEGRKASTAEKQKDKSGAVEGTEPHCSGGIAAKEEPAESSFICPSCLSSFGVMFDICPKCSASVQETMDRDSNKGEDKAIDKCEQTVQPADKSCSGTDSSCESRLERQPVQGASVEDAAFQTSSLTHKTSDLLRKEAAAPTTKFSVPAKNRVEAHKLSPTKNRGRPVRTIREDMDSGATPSGLLRCESCQGTMTPALRDIYDRARGLHAILGASVCFIIAFLCCIILNFFEGPSLSRITVFFFSSLFFLLGGILVGIGSFIYLAREKVYFCARCKRTYPRADISYLTAALVLASKRGIGSL